MTVRTVPTALVSKQHPNEAQLNPESVAAFEALQKDPHTWVVWQSGFAHHKASKAQAYNLRNGKRQKLLTAGHDLEFKAWKDPDTGDYQVIARFAGGDE